MRGFLVLRVVAKLLMPFMLVFALYVQFHGDFGPGGGFQAGVIIAATIIFYALIFGLPAARKLMPEPLVETMVALGVLIYAGVGVAGLLLGGQLSRLFRPRALAGARPGARHLLGRGGGRRHRFGSDDEDLLHVRRPASAARRQE